MKKKMLLCTEKQPQDSVDSNRSYENSMSSPAFYSPQWKKDSMSHSLSVLHTVHSVHCVSVQYKTHRTLCLRANHRKKRGSTPVCCSRMLLSAFSMNSTHASLEYTSVHNKPPLHPFDHIFHTSVLSSCFPPFDVTWLHICTHGYLSGNRHKDLLREVLMEY